MKRIVFNTFLYAFMSFNAIVFMMMGADIAVKELSKNKIFSKVDNIPFNKVAVVLGTNKHLLNGNVNLYYKFRLDAAYDLFTAHKVEFLLMSGDNGNESYDEPTQMKADLVARGIPELKIFLDFAGFRTWDSVIRTQKVFGQNKVTFVSQNFHNERALFIANAKGMDAVGYNARGIKGRYGVRVQIREKFARVKLLLDILFNKSPKFLGKKEQIS